MTLQKNGHLVLRSEARRDYGRISNAIFSFITSNSIPTSP